jgi:ArsR family transcriptional regulator
LAQQSTDVRPIAKWIGADVMKEFIRVMKALSDPSRIKILKMLQRRKLCVCEIQNVLGIAQSTTSKHLKLLENAGLVVSMREGQWINYQVSDGSQSEYVARQIELLSTWLEEDPAILKLIEKLPSICRDVDSKTAACCRGRSEQRKRPVKRPMNVRHEAKR